MKNKLKQHRDTLDEADNMESSYTLTIHGVKKNFSKFKLKRIVEKEFGDLNKFLLIPYIDWNILKVTCGNKESYERLLNLNSSFAGFTSNYKISKDIEFQIQSLPSENSTIAKLNYDCLYQICATCPLKTQIQLAKVSQQLLSIVTNIFYNRYAHNFAYDLYEFEFKHNLTEMELQDFLIICGEFVKKINFNTILNFPLIQRYSATITEESAPGGNLMQNFKKFINVNFCKNLPHFNNVQAIEVHGKFLADFTVRELARYCKNLKTFKLLDVSTRWLSGNTMHLLSNLTELCLRDCETLSPQNMLKMCRSLKHLSKLNIIDCILLQNEEFIVQMCARLSKLSCLKLSAIANSAALDAILTMPQLKSLKFYWLNEFPEFEALYFAKVSEHKRAQLVTLAFSTNRAPIENASKAVMTQENYALMRENTAINGRAWNFNVAATETETVTTLSKFTALNDLRFIYCRLLLVENLLNLCRLSKSLKCVRLLGCRQESDRDLLNAIQRMRCNGELATCDVCIAGLISFEKLQSQRQRSLALPYRTVRNNEPVVRSILCEFK